MVLSQIERRPAPMARVWHVEVLVNAGVPHVGVWAPLPVWFGSEPEAMRYIEDCRALDRATRPGGLARSYRTVRTLATLSLTEPR